MQRWRQRKIGIALTAQDNKVHANQAALNQQCDYLYLIQSVAGTIGQISQVLLSLANKRLTLAEKAIRAELRACAYWESCLIALLTKYLSEDNYFLDNSNGEMLMQINNKLTRELQAFIKAADYNLNYLEQYFEHDFWTKLTEDKVSVQLSTILAIYQDKNTGNTFTKR